MPSDVPDGVGGKHTSERPSSPLRKKICSRGTPETALVHQTVQEREAHRPDKGRSFTTLRVKEIVDGKEQVTAFSVSLGFFFSNFRYRLS
jgi:hypothetical protein